MRLKFVKMQQCAVWKKNHFSFSVNKTGVIGIDIKFAEETGAPYQLLTYAVYPKVALIENTGDCKLIDNI